MWLDPFIGSKVDLHPSPGNIGNNTSPGRDLESDLDPGHLASPDRRALGAIRRSLGIVPFMLPGRSLDVR